MDRPKLNYCNNCGHVYFTESGFPLCEMGHITQTTEVCNDYRSN